MAIVSWQPRSWEFLKGRCIVKLIDLKQKEKVKLGDIGENESKIDANEGVLEPIVAADLGIDMPESVHTKPKAPKPISYKFHTFNRINQTF